MDQIEPLPEPKASETALTIGKAAVNAIPVVGGVAAELIGGAVAPVIYRRQSEWLNRLADAVNELGALDEHWAIENLVDEEAFATSVMQAVEGVRRTGDEVKLDAFRNAVLNSVGPTTPDEYEHATFMRYLDELTADHIRIMRFGVDPTGWFEIAQVEAPSIWQGPQRAVFNSAVPHLGIHTELTDAFLTDLNDRRLVDGPGGTMVTEQTLWRPWVSPLGLRFLAFIEAPADLS